jgi:hypothetical protein
VASTNSVVMSDRLDTALEALGQGRSGEVLTPAGAAAQPAPAAPGPPAGAAGAAAGAPGTAAGQPVQTPIAGSPTSVPVPAIPGSTADLAGAARDHLRAAEAAAGRGDWTTYGTEMNTVHQLLDQLAAASGR